jgi:hypothetical protein
MPSPRSFLQPAVKVAAAGLGSLVAGPLGAALGGVLGDALGGASSKLIKDYVDKFGVRGSDAGGRVSCGFADEPEGGEG